MPDSEHRYDVELKCGKCGRETLATNGMWSRECTIGCDGVRTVTKTHDHCLNWKEMCDAGFSIAYVG